jgi:hypothetical protein
MTFVASATASSSRSDDDKGSFQSHSNRYFFEGQGISIETFCL